MAVKPEDRTVFISHSHRSNDVARDIADTLRGAGLTIWLDDERLGAGDDVRRLVEQALDDANAFVLLVDDQPSQWTHYEWSAIAQRLWKDPGTHVVPVLIGNAEPPGYLRDIQAVRLDPATGGGAGFEKILEHLNSKGTLSLSTPEGRERLSRRLAEVERAAAAFDTEADETAS